MPHMAVGLEKLSKYQLCWAFCFLGGLVKNNKGVRLNSGYIDKSIKIHQILFFDLTI